MKCVYLSEDEVAVIEDALDEYIFEHNLDKLPMNKEGEYYGDDEFEELDAKRMNAIQSFYSKILREEN